MDIEQHSNSDCSPQEGSGGSSSGLADFLTAQWREIGALREEMGKKQSDSEEASRASRERSDWMRAANENLILATFQAQDRQAALDFERVRQTEFLAMLAHELRNPLQPIAAANCLLEALTGVDASVAHAHAVISRQVAHLARLVDDLLQASRVGARKISVDKVRLSLSSVFEAAIDVCIAMVRAREQELVVHPIAPELIVDGDLVRLSQVVSNLLVNASKFTQHGGRIVLSAAVSGASAQITVADDGAGVPLDLQSNIFELFSQAPETRARSDGGLGIGLALAREICSLHGGSIVVHSAGAGTGSAFVVTLPLSPPIEAGGVGDGRVEAGDAAAEVARTEAAWHRLGPLCQSIDAAAAVSLSKFARHVGARPFGGFPSGEGGQ